MKRKSTFLRMFALLALMLPWTLQAQNAKVSEYDGSVGTATYSSIVSTGTAQQFSGDYVDVQMPFAMYFGETQVPQGSTLRIWKNGSVTFDGIAALADARISPLYLAAGYTTTQVYTRNNNNQVFTVEWRKVVSGTSSYSFQLKLYPNSDIEFCYGPMTINGSISVLVGMMSSLTDIYRVGGRDNGSQWDTIYRNTTGTTTRTLSSTYAPAYNEATSQGMVYSFTQPACVKPSTATATALAWNSIEVDWTVSSPGNGFEIKYSNVPGFNPDNEGQTKTVNDGSATTTNLTGLSGSTTYYIYVRKVCSGASSGWSQMATATTLPGCFSANMPTASAVGTVSWTSPDDMVTSYNIKYGPTGFNPATEGTAVNNISDLSYTITGLNQMATYDVYLSTNCSASGQTTDWVGPATFTYFTGSVYTMGTDLDVTTCNAIIYDDGGPADVYGASIDYTLIVRPGTADNNIRLQGNYDMESGWDFIMIYNGVGTSGTELLNASGSGNVNVVSSDPTGALTIRITSDGSVFHDGFELFASCEPMPTCPNPSTPTADAEANVSWTASNNASSYDLIWGVTGFDPATEGTLVSNLTGTTYTITGWASNTTYDVYVRAHCSATNENSVWSEGYTFTTACAPQELPYSEDFTDYSYPTYPYYGPSTIPNCWSFISNGTNTETTTGSSAYYGTVAYYSSTSYGCMVAYDKYFAIPAYGPSSSYAAARGSQKIAVLPKFNQNIGNLTLSFDYKMSSTSYGTLQLGYYYNGEFTSLTNITSKSTTTHFEQIMGNLAGISSAPAGARLALKWNMTSGSSAYWVGIDNVYVEQTPTCIKPTNLASATAADDLTATATLSWTESSPTPATQWEVLYWKAGSTDTISVIANTNPYTLGYLEVMSSYNWKVRSICSAEDQSAWSDVKGFATPCPNVSLGTATTMTIGDGTTTNMYIVGYEYYNYAYSQQIFTAAEMGGGAQLNSLAVMPSVVNGQRNYKIYLGHVDVATATSFLNPTDLTLVYDASVDGAVTMTANQWSTYTFSTPFLYNGADNLLVVFMDVTGSYNSGTHTAWYGTSSTSGVSRYVYRDASPYEVGETGGTTSNFRTNIVWGYQPMECVSTCNAPTTAITLSETEYAATLAFTDVNGETNPTYGIVYGPQGFDPTTAGTTVSPINTNTYTITGLAAQTTYDVYVYSICSGTPGRKVRHSFTTLFIPNCKVPVLSETGYGASNITYNTATLTWRQPGDTPQTWTVRYAATDFNPATAAAADYTELTIPSSNGATAQLTGLVAGNTYYVYVKATCSTSPVDESPWSDVYTLSTPNCYNPVSVTASDVTNSTAQISWTEAGNATAWTLKYGLHGFDPDMEGTAVACTAATYEITGLAAYTSYDVYVKSNCTATDESGWSTGVTFMTACPDGGDVEISGITNGTQYTIPVNTYYNYSYTQQIITADEIPGATTIQGISLKYDYSAALDPTKYDVTIYIGTTDKASFASSADFVDPATLTAVWHGTFNVEQGWNNFIFDTPFAYDGSSNIVVAFHDNVTGYNSSSHKFNTMTTDLPMALAYYSDSYNPDPTSATTLSAYSGTKTTYSYRNVMKLMAACNTDVTCFAPASVGTSITPANVVTVTWAPRTDLRPVVNNYELKYGFAGFNPDNQGAGTLVSNLNNVFNYTITDEFESDEDYDVYVRTVCGEGDYSNWTKATFHTYPTCWAPSAPIVTGTTNSSVTLSWTENTPNAATRWEVVYGLPGFNPDRATPVETTNNTGFVVNGLKHTTRYEFYVRAVCSATDHSDWSPVASAYTQCGVWQYEDMPLVEDFDSYTGNTGTAASNHVMPNCWNWINGGSSYAGLPSIYNSSSYATSGTNSLRFYRYNSTSTNYRDHFAILPEFGFKLDTLVVTFSARMTNVNTKFHLGTMSDPTDSTTYHEITAITPANTSYNDYEINLGDYDINPNDRYLVFVQRKTTGSYYVYLDDVTVKLREKVNSLAAGDALVACNEYAMPDTTGGSYPNNLTNATYVIRPAEAGKVAHISGTYDLEYGYDYLNVYRGAVNANNLIGRYTGNGTIDYKTNSNLWADSGYVTLVLTTDADNAFPYMGFKLLVQCEDPEAAPDSTEVFVENGSFAWRNGETYTNAIVRNGLTYDANAVSAPDMDRTFTASHTYVNVAGADSITYHMELTLHPSYNLTYNATICQRDEYGFYGNTYNATGTYTVAMQSEFGADSTGILNLQVNPAPSAAIYYGGNAVTEIANYCDNADLTLLARSNDNSATFVWEDNSTAATRVVNPHESNTYTVVATNPTTTCTSLPATVTVTTTPVPDLAISGDAEICYGQSATLTLADANNVPATYRWSTGATTTSITVNPTTTTTYTVTATTSNTSACQATAEFTVVVNPLPVVTATASVNTICSDSTITLTATAVDGYTYSWNTGAVTAVATTTATATGAYTVTVTDQNGCVNEFNTATVTVNPSYELSDSLNVCYLNNPYTWGAQQITANGNYDQMFTAQNGCDSLIHLAFNFEQMGIENSNIERCYGTTYTFENITRIATVDTALTYTLGVGDLDINGETLECPKRYNLTVKVNPVKATTVPQVVCDTYTWPVSGETYTVSGDYPVTLATTKNCDSVVTLALTVNYQNTGVETVTACDNYVWDLNGVTYTASTNEPTFTLQNQWGCDSVVTLDLTVNYRSYHEDFHCVRDAYDYTWINGQTYDLNVEVTDGIEFVTGTNALGCNEIAQLHLIMNPAIDTLNWATVDTCDEYEIPNAVVFTDENDCNGHIEPLYLRDNGDYIVRVRANDGHDQVARIHLTIHTSTYHTTIASECLPYTWTIPGENNEPYEVATITEEMVNGASLFNMSVDLADAGFITSNCSSIEVLRLTPKYPTSVVDTFVTICKNGSWEAENHTVFNGANYETGIYTWDDSELNAAGCPLTKQVNLTVNPVYNTTAELTFCESEFTNNALTVVNANNASESIELTIPGALGSIATPVANEVFSEDFEGSNSGWTTFDLDNYSNSNWQIGDYYISNGSNGMVIYSSYNDVEEANDWLITPEIDIPAGAKLIFDASGDEYEGNITHMTVKISTTGAADVNDFTTTLYQSVLEDLTWTPVEISLAAFAGQTVNIAFIHDSYNDDALIIDNVKVVTESMSSSTVYTNTVVANWTTAQGCDSIVTITYTVNPTTYEEVYADACYEYTWNLNGETYRVEDGTTQDHEYISDNGEGCNLVTILHLTLNDTARGYVDKVVCTSYEYNGVTYHTDKTFVEHYDGDLPVMNGCDSVTYINYHIQQTELIHQYVVTNRPYTWQDGQTYSQSVENVYYDAPGEGDCGNVYTLHLTMVDSIAFCDDALPYNTNVNGIVIETVDPANVWSNNDPNGNDTILYYTVNKTYNTTETVDTCDNYTWEGTTYTESGSYTVSYSSIDGCDSTLNLNLTIRNSNATTVQATVCDTYTWTEGNGNTYTESGTYTFDTTNVAGCDSIVTLNLTINKNNGVEITESACDTYTWTDGDGQTYTVSGDYSFSFNDANNCSGDSVLHLTINPTYETNSELVVNEAASYTYLGVMYTAPFDSTITHTFQSINGCDSIDHLRIIIPIVDDNNIVEIDTQACGSFTWTIQGVEHTYIWIPMSERQSHGMAMYKDATFNKYVYTYPTDTTFVNGVMTHVDVLHLNLLESTTSTMTVDVPLSLGHYDIISDTNDTYVVKTIDFSARTVQPRNFTSILDTVGVGSVAYCDNIRAYTINLIDNYDTTEYFVCADATTYEWGTETYTVGEPGHTYFFTQKENDGTMNELVHTRKVNQRAVNAETITATACDSYVWASGDSLTYTTSVSGVVYNYTDANGCAATKTLNLTVNYNTNSAITEDVCDSYTWTAGTGNAYTASGDYTYSYNATAAGNCPSVDTLHLTIRNNTNQTLDTAACETFTWSAEDGGDGRVLTTSGTETYNYTATNGCPSVNTLNLTINTNTNETINKDECDTYTWIAADGGDGQTYTASGTYTYDYNTTEGCPSTNTLNLTIRTSTSSVENLAQCDKYTWVDNIEHTESGVYTYTGTNVAGCDSNMTLNLTINVNNTGVTIDTTVCDEFTWDINNRFYNATGVYTANTTDGNGCAATNTLNLTVNSSNHYDSILYISDGSYRYYGQNATELFGEGVYTRTEHYTNAIGCDSALNITFNIGTALLGIDNVVKCNEYTWRNGKTYTYITPDTAYAHRNSDNVNALYYNTTDGEYVYYNPTYTVPRENAFDSIYMLALTLTQSYTGYDEVTLNISDRQVTYGNSTFNFDTLADLQHEFVSTDKEFDVHFPAVQHCDSVITLTVHLVNNYQMVDADDICVTTTSYTWRNHEISTATTEYDDAHTYYVYDTLATGIIEYRVVNQHPFAYATERRTACDSYTWNGTTYTESTSNATAFFAEGTVINEGTPEEYTLVCDSTVTLILTINKNTNTAYTVAECNEYTWAKNGVTYTESGDYEYDYFTNKGCPSTDTLHLTINLPTSTDYIVDACDTYTWSVEEGGDGRVLTASGEYTYDYNSTVGGCASTNTLTLTIRNNSNQTVTKTVCDTYTWAAEDNGNGETYTISGTYTYDYTAANGCPSTNTLNLTVNQNSGHTDDIVACDSAQWHGVWYYADNNTATYDYVDNNNCPSVDALNLTINHATYNSETVVACQTYTWHGSTITNPSSVGDMFHNNYEYNYVNDEGCPSVDYLDLTLGGGRTFATQAVTNCGPYTWVVNDSTIGVIDETIETSTSFLNPRTGCDSVIFLNLTVLEAPMTDIAVAICDSELPYTWVDDTNSIVLTEAGVATVAYDFSANCDSTVRLTLTVNPTEVTNLTDQICLGNDYTANGFNIAAADLPAAGEYTFVDHRTTDAGCEHTYNLTLTVGDVLNNTLAAVSACDSYTWNNTVYTVSGNYESEPYANNDGCTTIDILPLTINTGVGSVETEVACDGFMWRGEQRNATGDYFYTDNDANGCTYTDTLHLTINNSVINNIPITACDSYTWVASDNNEVGTYTASGVYTYNYTTVDGCNGTDNLILTINTNSNTEYTETACDSYTWNEVVYTVSGDYEFEYESASGCPSKDILHLTINNSTTSEETAESCSFYNWHGETYTATGDYTYVSTNDAGCQNTATLHLTVNNPVNVTIDTTVCGAFAWNGINYLHSDVITHSFTAANGCDSIEVINLTVNNPVSTTLTETACDSYTWDVTGETYTVSDVYMAQFAAANGCDSIVMLHLTVNNNTNSSETVTACDSYTWNGQTYTTSGTQTYAYTATNGCASVDTLYLTINNSTISEQTAAACNNYTWNGNVYIQSGDYTNVTTNNAGCADTAILHLTINTPVTNNITETTCNSYTWNGQTYSNSGIYTATFTAANGCDSIVNLMLTISAPVTNTVNATACDSYTWNGTAYNTTGTYTYNGTAANGCDSIVTLNLVINNSATNAISATACNSYTWNGATYTTTGSYTQTFTTTAGCDSVVTLALAISPAYQTEINQSACSSYTWNGTTYTTSGNYTSTFTAANGCDSVVTLNLTVTPTINMTVTATACDSYTWNGTAYTTSGNYTHTYTAAGGCDSVVTLALTVNNSTTGTATETVCDSYSWNGQVYTTSGNYTHNYTAANGCDSVVTLTLTVNNSIAVNTVQTVCDSYTWNGLMYVASGVYTQSFDAANGCDSTVTLTLTVNHSTFDTFDVAICDGFEWEGNVYNESGMYTYVTTTTLGCDSTIIVNLTVNHSVETYDTISILSTQLPYNYHGNNIPAEGDYVFNGTTVNGCDSTVYLKVNVQEVGIEVVNSLDDVTIYPNPTRGRVTVSAEDVVKIEVLDIVGRLVATFENTNTFDISNLGEGAYTLRITLPEGMTVRKVVKK